MLRSMSSFCTIVGIVLCGVALADPIEPADPASEVIEKLIAEKQDPPAPPPPSPEPNAPPSKNLDREPIDPLSVDSIVDDVASQAAQHKAKSVQEALALLQRAQSAQKDGRTAEALRLALAAQKLDPDNADITTTITSLRKSPKAESSKYGKATAHLAAGLTRGRLLLQQGRYTAGKDLLNGVVRAAELFPQGVNVSMYRRLALKELESHKARIDAGIIPAESTAAAGLPIEEPILVATGSAAPENARRILRPLESQTPFWYSESKTKLGFRMTVNYPDASAVVVFDDIAKQTGVKILLDDPVVRARSHLNAKVNLRVSDVPAETILNLACLKSGLEYVITERAVVVTTPARALRYMQDLSEALQDNWLAVRVVFPELTPELLASPPLPIAAPGPITSSTEADDADVAAYLLSGDALVKDVESLLR